MMSDKDDPVLDALIEARIPYHPESKCCRMINKALAIQKAQARVIEAADMYAVERSKGMSAPMKLGKLKEALAALDEVKKG